MHVNILNDNNKKNRGRVKPHSLVNHIMQYYFMYLFEVLGVT